MITPNKTNYLISPYDWSQYLFGQILGILSLFMPNKTLGFVLGPILTLLGAWLAFRSVKLSSELIVFHLIFRKNKKYSWNDIKTIRFKHGVNTKSTFHFQLHNGGKFFFYATREIEDFIVIEAERVGIKIG